jgi:uncharacterized SAM-binding protein YcdF (DUF218 family)
LIAVFSLLLLYARRADVLPLLAGFLDVSEPPQATDYVMVLGGDNQTRPFVAAALVKVGLARKALVAKIKRSGDNLDGIVPSDEEMIRSVLVRQGVPPDAVVMLDKECASTFDEACALAEFLASEPQSSVTIVTSCYHSRRARFIFRKVMGERSARLHVQSAPADGFNETNWWHFESGCQYYITEYLKLAFYLLRY